MVNMGAFGNIWVRQHHYAKKGDFHRGHLHYFDHVTLVATGGVLCEIEGEEPKEIWSPTFIAIAKDKLHKFTALADNTTYFCIFAVRDESGQVVDPACIECGACGMVARDSPGAL
jgi:quercetin dioxygenase-like cupin family protein